MTHRTGPSGKAFCIHTIQYQLHEVEDYINWCYFYHAWGVRADNGGSLRDDAIRLLRTLDAEGCHTTVRIALSEATSQEDDIVLADGRRIPLLRQQQAQGDGCYLCLSDFVRPMEQGIADRIGIFVASTQAEVERLFADDDYRHLLAQTLADRLAEASIEKAHEQARREWWGYAPGERLDKAQLFAERFQGIRPAVGYPSLPDQSLNFVLDSIVDFGQAGVSLTENGAMLPHASVSGLMIAHPMARHFSVGRIGEDQLRDYARRRGKDVEWLRRFFRSVEAGRRILL